MRHRYWGCAATRATGGGSGALARSETDHDVARSRASVLPCCIRVVFRCVCCALECGHRRLQHRDRVRRPGPSVPGPGPRTGAETDRFVARFQPPAVVCFIRSGFRSRVSTLAVGAIVCNESIASGAQGPLPVPDRGRQPPIPRYPEAPRIARYRRISAFVELSCVNSGSSADSNSGMIRWASALPSSTPHWSKELIDHTTPWVKTLCS
jgi:hypothetical protein